ncbi:MAG: MG2 domain-containing protein, partial [Verrucomicrobiota bacterium]
MNSETDENGLFRIRGADRKNLILLARHNGWEVATANNYWVYKQDRRTKPFLRTIFFTDRSLYRPGQIIQYKGICVDVDQEKDNYKTLAGRKLTVIFRDVNGKEVARHKQTSNDYGSFSGSFNAPRDRLMGRMRIQVEGQPGGQAWFNVEEYKRPKFQVSLEKPEVAARLNKDVTVKGKAMAYTGASIDGARVKWRVVRQVHYPVWWHWCYWWRSPVSGNQEIANGTGKTDALGNFEITFNALPDRKVDEKDEPTFLYTVYADVTDSAGETRSARQMLNAGYTALKASFAAASWLTVAEPVKLTVLTQTLDGLGQAAEGTVKIHALKQPEQVAR